MRKIPFLFLSLFLAIFGLVTMASLVTAASRPISDTNLLLVVNNEERFENIIDSPESVNLLANTTYTQDFDSLVSSGAFITYTAVPDGWAFHETGTNANGGYRVGNGSANTGDTYSFGATNSPDRAFGSLLSGSLAATIGVQFQNDGDTIGGLAIAYYCEQWRLGATGRFDRMDFQYSTDATSLTNGAWTDFDDLDCVSTEDSGSLGARDGNAVRTFVSDTITGLRVRS